MNWEETNFRPKHIFFQLQHRNHAQMYLFILFICLCYSKKRKLKGKKSRERKHTHPQQSFKGYQVRHIFWHQWINAQDLALSAVSQMCNITSLFHKRHTHTWLAGYLIQASGKTWGKKNIIKFPLGADRKTATDMTDTFNFCNTIAWHMSNNLHFRQCSSRSWTWWHHLLQKGPTDFLCQ